MTATREEIERARTLAPAQQWRDLRCVLEAVDRDGNLNETQKATLLRAASRGNSEAIDVARRLGLMATPIRDRGGVEEEAT